MSLLFHGQRTISNEHQKDLTCDFVRHIVFEDKELYFIVERPGFRKLVNTLCPSYSIPSRKQVTEIADEIADQCLTDLKSKLSKHIANGGTVCLAADACTKKRRRFTATVAYFLVKWRLKLIVTSCKAVPMGQSVTAEKIVVNLVEGLERVGLSMENVFAATKDEGADIAAAFRVTPCVDVPCSAHVQQTCVRRCPHSPLH